MIDSKLFWLDGFATTQQDTTAHSTIVHGNYGYPPKNFRQEFRIFRVFRI